MRLGYSLVLFCACAASSDAPAPPDRGPAAVSRELRCVGHHCDVRRSLADSIIRGLRDGTLADLPRIVPDLDRRDGIKLYAIRPASSFEQLGFRNGDVIRAVDGVPLVAARLRESLEPLAPRIAHTVEIDRGGAAVILELAIVD